MKYASVTTARCVIPEVLAQHSDADGQLVCGKVVAALQGLCGPAAPLVVCPCLDDVETGTADSPLATSEQIGQHMELVMAKAEPPPGAVEAHKLKLVITDFVSRMNTRMRYKQRLARKIEDNHHRSLRWKSSGTPVAAPALPEGHHFHVFLSHDWRSHGGRDVMRILKMRLQQMFSWSVSLERRGRAKRRVQVPEPTFKVFLDVDDLKQGTGPEYLKQVKSVLVFVTDKFFTSRSAMRELIHAVRHKVPLVALMERDPVKGGLTMEQVRHCIEVTLFEDDLSPQQVYDALFAQPPIEWARITAFQNVSIRLIAEAVLQVPPGSTCVADEEFAELSSELTQPKLESSGYHMYVSPSNVGAMDLVDEAREAFSSELQGLSVTVDAADMAAGSCEMMLVYLNGLTWTSGPTTENFVAEILEARRRGVHILLANEDQVFCEPGPKHGCNFEEYFVHTPECLQESYLYDTISVPLRAGAWRTVSLRMLAETLLAIHTQVPTQVPRPPPLLKARSSIQHPEEPSPLLSPPIWTFSSRFRITSSVARALGRAS